MLNDVERAKRMLAGGDLWAVSGARGNTSRWYGFPGWKAECYAPGMPDHDGELVEGPFYDRGELAQVMRERYPRAQIFP